jgi:hypothetical protein
VEIEGWHASIVERCRLPAPDRRHERNMLGFQSATNESNDAESGTVQPLRVVDDYNQRHRVSYFADEPKGGDRHAIGIGLEVDTQTKGGFEGLPLLLRQLRDRSDDWTQELVQARKS